MLAHAALLQVTKVKFGSGRIRHTHCIPSQFECDEEVSAVLERVRSTPRPDTRVQLKASYRPGGFNGAAFDNRVKIIQKLLAGRLSAPRVPVPSQL